MAEGKRVVRQYTVEFKIDAVELVEKKGYGITEAARSRWAFPSRTSTSGAPRALPSVAGSTSRGTSRDRS